MKDVKSVARKSLSRDLEFSFSMIGGIMGIFGSAAYVFTSNTAADGWRWPLLVFLPALLGVAASIVGWKVSYNAQYEPVKAGVFLIVCSLVVFGCLTFFGSITTLLFLIAGLLCLIRRSPKVEG